MSLVPTNHQRIYDACQQMIESIDDMKASLQDGGPSWDRLESATYFMRNIVRETSGLAQWIYPPWTTYTTTAGWTWTINNAYSVDLEDGAS